MVLILKTNQWLITLTASKNDNRLENLEWATAKENTRHAFDTGLHNANHFKKKVLMLTLDDKPLLWFDSLTEASKATNTNLSSISNCCVGSRKKAGGYKWKHFTDFKKIKKD